MAAFLSELRQYRRSLIAWPRYGCTTHHDAVRLLRRPLPWYALVASAHAAILGATIMAKEKRDHSADFLFTKPVPVPGSSARDCSPQCSISSRLRSSPRCSPW